MRHTQEWAGTDVARMGHWTYSTFDSYSGLFPKLVYKWIIRLELRLDK